MKKFPQNGISLVELVVATSVISVLLLLMMNFVAGRIADNAINNARSDVQLQTQLTLDVINRDIKYSANVDDQNRWEDSYSPGSPTNNYSWTSDDTTLILASPAEDQDNNVLYEDPQTYISYKNNFIYFVEGNTLYKRILAADIPNNKAQTTCPAGVSGCPQDIKLADNVQDFSVNYYDANDTIVSPSQARSVEVTLLIERTVFGRFLSEQQAIRSVFRNE